MNKESDFIQQKFTEYYKESEEHIQPPESMEKREFGFVLFKEKMMVRHKSFTTEESFKSFIISSSPSDIYHSSAYYEKPEASMEKKKLLGADLIFDIDSDHLETPCKNEHEYWICRSCDNAGIGQPPERCLQCESSSFKKEAWLCDSCLEVAKTETLKLIDFLTDDFGFLPKEIEVSFSGQRGYHVCIKKEEVKQLNQVSRKEIVDYISGTGLIFELHGLAEIGSPRQIIGPDLSDSGWNGRIAKGVYGFLLSSTQHQLEQVLGRKKAIAKNLFDNREFILKEWSRKVPWGIKGMELEAWKKLIPRAIRNQAAIIDTVVTTDMHRLIRLPRSLHGKTGLMAMDVPLNAFKRFDPLKEAVAFTKGTLEVFVREAHKFRVGDEEFGPYTNQIAVLPMAAAIYLLCKRVAETVKP